MVFNLQGPSKAWILLVAPGFHHLLGWNLYVFVGHS